MRCPRCLIDLSQGEDEGVLCATCPDCGGTWISSKALERLVERATAATGDSAEAARGEESLAALSATVSAANTGGELRCAECHAVMTKERFHPMIPVQIDRCERCDYVWLDAGEKALLVRLHRELHLSDDPEVAGRRDKLDRLAELQNGRLEGFEEMDGAMETIGGVAGQVPGVMQDLAVPRYRAPTVAGGMIWMLMELLKW